MEKGGFHGHGHNNFKGGKGGNHQHQTDSKPQCKFGLGCTYLYTKNGCKYNHDQSEKDIAKQVFILKKFYDGKPAAFLTGDGELFLHRFNIPVHVQNKDDIKFGSLYKVSLGKADAKKGSFEV